MTPRPADHFAVRTLALTLLDPIPIELRFASTPRELATPQLPGRAVCLP